MKLVTAAAMREMDRRTIEEFATPGILLMENAALRIVEEIASRFGPLAGKSIVVLCGKGNNGGDGLAIARHLAGRFAAEVVLWTTFDPDDPAAQAGDAGANLVMARAHGLILRQYTAFDADAFGESVSSASVIVDSLFGTGIRGTIEGHAADMVELVNRARQNAGDARAGRPSVVAVDIPSGVQADTGDVPGPAISADLTVTFALAKIGLLQYPGAANVGELVVGDIGMPRSVIDEAPAAALVTTPADIVKWLPARTNGRDSNKGQFGHVMVFAGSRGFLGAANLASAAAARTGAGLVSLIVPEELLSPAMGGVNPVVMTRGLPQTSRGTFGLAALEEALKLCAKAAAVAIGPELGGTDVPETAEFVREFVRRCPVPLVVDADALNILSSEPDRGASIVAGRSAATVLTPHPGEMGRLLGLTTDAVQSKRLDCVAEAARDHNCTVLLKGARTLIASPGGILNVNTTSNAGMATGGAGDVLTGVIAALLSCGLGPHEGASAGAHIHGLAGDIVAERQGGMAGLIAEDLLGAIPTAIGRCQTAGH